MLHKHGSGEKVFFTADTHFNHRNIIKYCNRPFAPSWEIEDDSYGHDRVREMNEALKDNWNEVVPEDGIVYFLGDFIFLKKRYLHHAVNLLHDLNGTKILIKGNHDPGYIRDLEGWSEVFLQTQIEVQGTPFVLYHYPLESWPGQTKGVKLLHGHSHGKAPERAGRLDVGVDCFHYKPVSYAQVMEVFNA